MKIRAIQNKLGQLLKKILSDRGYVLKRIGEIRNVERQHVNALREILNGIERKRAKNGGVGIVFSKDRPIQLHALLQSYRDNAHNPCPLIVLYAASDENYAREYAVVMQYFPDNNILFKAESSFRNDLIALLESIEEDKVFFLVDDIIFIRPIYMNDFLGFDPKKYVPTLRLGKNLSRCYTFTSRQEQPPLVVVGDETRPQKFKWLWSDGRFDWGYPLSVDGNLFLTDEVLVMAKLAEYRAPNSFEQALQWFMPAFSSRSGVCYEKSVVVNIPFNKVQSENNNKSGNVSQEALLNYWQQGYEIDVQKYYGINNVSAHQELLLHLTKRRNRLK